VRKKQKPETTSMAVRDHIRELERRLLVVFVLLVAAGVTSYFYYHQILDILRAPLHQELYYTTPVGSFAFIMRICMIGGIAVAIPAIIYNLLMFVRPAFSKPMQRGMIILVTLASLGLAALGALFSYSVILPGALHFFGGFSVDGLSALISADNYLNFVINALIVFMLMFQLPLIITIIDRMKPLQMKKLFKAERWVILGSLVVALLVPFAMDLSVSLLISLPIILLYNLSIAIVAVRHSLTKKSKPVKQSKEVNIKSPVVTAGQLVTVNPAQIKATAVPAVQTQPSQTIISPNKTPTIKAKPAHRLMDVQSYPINNSSVIADSKATPKISQSFKLDQTINQKPVVSNMDPIFRTEIRSAPKLSIPERKAPMTRIDFGRAGEFDS